LVRFTVVAFGLSQIGKRRLLLILRFCKQLWSTTQFSRPGIQHQKSGEQTRGETEALQVLLDSKDSGERGRNRTYNLL